MNIIRTRATELTTIPAVAYKQKLASGGAGVKLMRIDREETAVATIDKRTGEPVHYGIVDESLFPYEAFEEAVDLLEGLPYSARGKLKINVTDAPDAVDIDADGTPEKISMVDSDEYLAIIERYCDENNKLNYQLMNKDFIQFAAKSKVVSTKIDSRASVEEIMVFVVKSRAAMIAGKKESLPDDLAKALIETLDEIDPRSAFKELAVYIRRMQGKNKK